jgi:hypothetical protein
MHWLLPLTEQYCNLRVCHKYNTLHRLHAMTAVKERAYARVFCTVWNEWIGGVKSETGAAGIPTKGDSSRVNNTVSVQQLADVSELHTFSSYRAVNTPRLGYKNQSEMKAACSESHTKHMIKTAGSENSNQIQDPTTTVAHLSSSCGCNTFWLRVQSCELDQSAKQNSRTARACTVSDRCNSYLQCLMLADNKIHLLSYFVLLYLIFRAPYWKSNNFDIGGCSKVPMWIYICYIVY